MSKSAIRFVHLRNHSAYSLAEGAIPVKDLVGLAKTMGMPAVAMTDTNNLFGAMEFSEYAVKDGIQPILGSQLHISLSEKEVEKPYQIVLLVQNTQGYKNLSLLISHSFLQTESIYKPQIPIDMLLQHHEGLICLTGGYEGPVDGLLMDGQKDKAEDVLESLHKVFTDRLYIEIMRHDRPEKEQHESTLIDLAYEKNIPLVATNNCFFAKREMHKAHDALLCIADGRYVIEKDRRKETPEHYFKSPREMESLFEDLPEAIENTIKIARRCHHFLDFVKPILPAFPTSQGRTEEDELRVQSKTGLQERLEKYVFKADISADEKEKITQEYFDRLEYELGIITEMGFSGYFLIVSDFIQWAKDNNIPVGPGRGSGAASIIAWALKITDLDPIHYSLLFERFLNPERVSMPDFDIDFCQDRRDEVIQYVQGKYGKDRVAQIITFGKLQARAVVRDVGRVLQMSYGQVDKIAKLIPNNPANPTTLQEALDTESELRNLKNNDENIARLIEIALQLEGLYRHASTHAAGLVIADRPLHELVPLYRDPKSDMPVTQFNMKSVEKAGLVKFDFLGLKTLTVLQKSAEIVQKEHGIDIDLLAIPLDDKKSFEMLAKGDNTGVFQLESAGMRDAGKQMRLETLEEIIALVALYRPGPMDNIPKFIACKHGQEEQDFMHPLLEPILKETFGIMIYQEQVMQAAQILAGYTLGGADLLRRAMGKKIQEEMDAQRALFVDGAKTNHKVPEERASAIFDQISKFAGYGFNKAHAAAYALVSYQTAYMKANYPHEFMAAIMTLDMGNTDKLNVFKEELGRMNIQLLPPDINKSESDFSIEILPSGEKALRYALAAIKGVGRAAMDILVAQRKENGEYKDVFDFAERSDSKIMNKRQVENLTKAGAFDSLESNRARMFKSIEILSAHASAISSERQSGQESLFGGGADLNGNNSNRPKLPDLHDWDIFEKLQYEFDAIGFFLSAHPLDSEKDKLKAAKILSWDNILKGDYDSRGRTRLAGVVLKKQEKISAKGNKFAFVQLSDTSGVFEAIVFSETLAANRDLLEAGKTIIVSVDVQKQGEDETPRLTIQSIQSLDKELEKGLGNIEVEIDDERGLAILVEALTKCQNGTQTISILCPAERPDNKESVVAVVQLPQKFSVNLSFVRFLQGQEAIRNVRTGLQ